MKSVLLWLGLCSGLLSFVVMADSSSTPRALTWQGTPLALHVAVDKELIIQFDSDVRVAMPAYLSGKATVTTLAGRVYLTSFAPFERARFHVERLNDGARLLLDITASSADDGSVTAPSHVDIVWPSHHASTAQDTPNKPVLPTSATLKMAPQALLVRYAMQNLYSPSHAIEPLNGVMRAPMGLPSSMPYSLFPKWSVHASPVAAWRLGKEEVTAITLTNTEQRPITLDPRYVTLGGRCLLEACYVAFSHPNLGPAGSATDSASAFIVTSGRLVDHLLPPREVTHD